MVFVTLKTKFLNNKIRVKSKRKSNSQKHYREIDRQTKTRSDRDRDTERERVYFSKNKSNDVFTLLLDSFHVHFLELSGEEGISDEVTARLYRK